jgi:gas vesicle protein
MTDSPDAIRADIERTRSELGLDVDALADKVNPSKIADRQVDKVKGAFGSIRDRIMGAADDAGSSASGLAEGASAVARDVTAKAQGNPLAVGLIAFGAGLLAASLIPASSKEKDLAQSAKAQAQPLVEEVTGVAKEAVAHLKAPAEEAVAAVKDRAQEGLETVKEEGSDAAGTVRDRVGEARSNVTEN